jgi:hypothetical protein
MGNYHVPFWRAVGRATSSLTLIIKNEGLRLLALGISTTANRGSVNPKGSGRKKSTNFEVAPIEIGNPRTLRLATSVG